MPRFFYILILGLWSCSTSPVIRSDGHSYKVMEGRFEQFVKDLHWEKSETTDYTHVTTGISGWDTTFDPSFTAGSIQAKASKKQTDRATKVEIKFSFNDVTYTHDFRTDGKANPNITHSNYTAHIIETGEEVDVEFLGHFSGQDGIVYSEWEEFSFPLSPSFIERLKALRAPDDEKFIGEAINIEFVRAGFETAHFKILPSEILAAIHGLESGTICDPEYEKRLTRYVNLCPAVFP